MKQIKKRLLGVVLALIMVFSVVPMMPAMEAMAAPTCTCTTHTDHYYIESISSGQAYVHVFSAGPTYLGGAGIPISNVNVGSATLEAGVWYVPGQGRCTTLSPLHTHSFASAWSTDATSHWHACTGTGSTDACLSEAGAAKGNHTGGTATCQAKAKCSTCQAEYGDYAAHNYGYSVSGSVLTAACKTSGCTESVSVTISANDATFNGSAYTGASMSDTTTWNAKSLIALTIKYEGTGETTYPQSATAPTNAGTYKATITADGKTAEAAFTINKASQTAPAADEGYTLTYDEETLVAADKYEVSTEAEEDAVALTDDKVTPGETYFVRKKENANYNASPWTAINTPARPAAPKGLTTDAAIEEAENGIIRLVNNRMEYKFSEDTEWTAVTGEMVTGLKPGEYEVRYKATESAFASEIATVTVEKHIHHYNTEVWSRNENTHWHAPMCDHKELKIDEAEHVFGEDGVCVNCKAVKDEPVVDEPTDDEPVVDEPTDDEPVVDEPTDDEPVVDEPTDDEPVVDEPTDDEPVVDEPTDDEPVVDEPTDDEPAVDEPTEEEIPVYETYEAVPDANDEDAPETIMVVLPNGKAMAFYKVWDEEAGCYDYFDADMIPLSFYFNTDAPEVDEPTDDTPQTGDTGNVLAWMAILALLGAAVAVSGKKKVFGK